MKPIVMGDGIIPEAQSVFDVRDALPGRADVVLLAHVAKPLGLAIPAGSTIYNLEPLYDGCRSLSVGYMDVLRTFPVWDYQARNVEYLRTHGVTARHVPYRYSKALERVTERPKDIEVLFFGSMTPRRHAVLDQIAARCRLVTAQGVYGAELDALVARSCVVVNVHHCTEPHPLEVVRLNYLMANGCAVVSERGWDDAENAQYAPGLLLSEDLATDCAELVRDNSRRAVLSAAARATIRSLPFTVPT
jgi:hypothetical protein